MYRSASNLCYVTHLFSLSKEAILSFNTTSRSSSPSLYLCRSHSLSANVGSIYLFYLGMSDSWVCSSACCNRGICKNCQRRMCQSLNQCSRDWVQCVLHVYLMIPECLQAISWQAGYPTFKSDIFMLCTQESVDCTQAALPHAVSYSILINSE